MTSHDGSPLSVPLRVYANLNHSLHSLGLNVYQSHLSDSKVSLSNTNLSLPYDNRVSLEGPQSTLASPMGQEPPRDDFNDSFVEFDFGKASKRDDYEMRFGGKSSQPQPEPTKAKPKLGPAPVVVPKPSVNPEDDDFFSGTVTESEGFAVSGEWKEIKTVTDANFYDDRGAVTFANDRRSLDEAERQKAALHGYTRIDAEEQATKYSAINSKTDFLFLKEAVPTEVGTDSDSDLDYDEQFQPPSTSLNANETPAEQLQNTKAMLLDVEKIAYVGLVNLTMIDMATDLAKVCTLTTKLKVAKKLSISQANFGNLYQRVMEKVYEHMDLNAEERLMIEKLSQHGIQPRDICGALISLTPKVVENPVYEEDDASIGTDVKDVEPSATLSALSNTAVAQGPARDSDDASSKNNAEAFDEASSITMASPYTSGKDLDPVNPFRDTTSTQETSKEPILNPFSDPDPASQTPEKLPVRMQKTLSIDLKWTLMCDLFLLLVSDQVYDARCRTLLFKAAANLDISELEVCLFEKKVTESIEVNNSTGEEQLDEKDLVARRSRLDKRKRAVYIGLATIGGGLVIGLSAGLLAPVIGAGIAAGLTTVGIAGTSGFLAGVGGTAIVTTTGVIAGARVGSKGMAKRVGSVKTFEFKPLHHNQRTNLIITVSGWMNSTSDDVRLPFSTVDPIMGDLFSLLWEPEMLTSMGQTINILATEALTQSIQQILGSTVLIGLMASIQLPMALSKLGYLLDNPWNVSLDRAYSSGLILADTLMARNLGLRPVTLVGFSLGAKLIYTCLTELAKRGAYGLVENVYIFGAPVTVQHDQMSLARSVVSGRFVNGFSKKDWILGYLFRATGGGLRSVAGLSPIESIYGIENFDCTEYVEGHMAYRKVMPLLMSKVGWEVLSEEFVEIDGPDPEQQERQRKLILEFEEAKDKMNAEIDAKKRKKKGWKTWFTPKKKEWWEIYEEGRQEVDRKQAEGKIPTDGSYEVDLDIKPADVYFDVDDTGKLEEEELLVAGSREARSSADKMKDAASDVMGGALEDHSRVPEVVQMSFDQWEDDRVQMTFEGDTEEPVHMSFDRNSSPEHDGQQSFGWDESPKLEEDTSFISNAKDLVKKDPTKTPLGPLEGESGRVGYENPDSVSYVQLTFETEVLGVSSHRLSSENTQANPIPFTDLKQEDLASVQMSFDPWAGASDEETPKPENNEYSSFCQANESEKVGPSKGVLMSFDPWASDDEDIGAHDGVTMSFM
ncbi:hypothetical protein BABINDRAFT_160300 [Babjeviella inositovora NRRL Y-12698]|uniref:DUF726-domain-containing protein n=1 Tax=Babjeviella inositovora NRRL Y-12698 TaxID=984486 RepID=A0A1E3QWP6_9ASCO|nr:uncharacterized protein BABINDRAFT_160300 [Babjeviella inositovora NRRL Y-12698]ODQ82108.1 hypothetical protein BABINDRAFT_160300 [Babjeviella inositovora NRRL Y-12698]